MSVATTNYAKRRYIGYFFITAIALILPFIRIDGNHFFLLSFDKKQLHLLFTAFDTQELFLMPFVLIIGFLFIFFMTTLGGRVWCGWSCPQTIFRTIYRDLICTKLLKIRKNIKDKQSAPKGHFIKKAFAAVLWACLAVLAASNLMWYFIPPEDFFGYLNEPKEHILLFSIVAGFTIFLIYDVLVLAENFCIFVCPYARIQSVMFDHDTIQVIYDENRGGKIYDHAQKLGKKPLNGDGDCIGCEACVAICPTHIDIRRGMQLECINCLECADACSQVMAKMDKKSLISWTSAQSIATKKPVKYFRFRTIAYIIIISVATAILAFMTTKKESFLLNINRTTELYKISSIGGGFEVQNAYTFLLQNTSNKDQNYNFSISDQRIKMLRPAGPISLKAGAKRKFVVVLATSSVLISDHTKDTPLKIRITASSDEASIDRNTVFVFPKITQLKD